MKLLLYCTKSKPYLYKTERPMIEKEFGDYHTQLNKAVLNDNCLNGKIIAECDFEVEDIEKFYCCGDIIQTKTMTYEALLGRSCLTDDEFKEYNPTKATHIKNLHIFDEPKELSECKHPFILCNNYCDNNFVKSFCRNICSHNSDPERLNVWCDRNDKIFEPIVRAPQNMMRVVFEGEEYILISIRSLYMCLILNKIKDIELRRVVLKEMLK